MRTLKEQYENNQMNESSNKFNYPNCVKYQTGNMHYGYLLGSDLRWSKMRNDLDKIINDSDIISTLRNYTKDKKSTPEQLVNNVDEDYIKLMKIIEDMSSTYDKFNKTYSTEIEIYSLMKPLRDRI